MTPLRERGAQAVADVWNAAAGPKYRIDAALVEQNLLKHPLLHEEASLWWEDTFVAIKRSAASLYDGPDPKVAHVSLLGGPSGDHDLRRCFPSGVLQIAIEILRDEGYEALVVGQDSGHFLPGAPTDVPWTVCFAEVGFQRGGLAFDLEYDIEDVGRSFALSRAGSYRRLREDEKAALDRFLTAEFPGRWHYDVMRKVEAEGAGTVYVVAPDDEIQGFALLQNEGCRLPIGGAVWQADLGEQWGSLGPIGIAKALRGRNLGNELLSNALWGLKERGARRTIIDWTGLVDFYGTQRFSVNRTYRSYRLPLSGDRPPAT